MKLLKQKQQAKQSPVNRSTEKMADTLISNTVIYSYTHSFCAMLCMNKKVKNEIDESSRIFLISNDEYY